MKKLSEFQQKIKVKKGQYNSFGKYNYRSCEDIVEALKPIINKEGYYLLMNDEIVQIGERYYVKSSATITNGEDDVYTSHAYAREPETKKGMDESQITGAASSYARKYALNALLAIDDSKDSDNEQQEKKEITPDSENWNKAIEYYKKNDNLDGVLKHYIISEDNIQKIKNENT